MPRSRLFAAVLLVASSAFAVPYTTTLTPTEDAFVWEGAPDSSHGRAGALSLAGPTATNENGDAQGVFHSFAKFDAAGAVSDLDAEFGAGRWFIRDVVLTLTEDGDPRNPRFNEGAGAFEIRWIADDSWQEGTGGGNGKFPADGVTFNATPSFLNAATDASLGTGFMSAGVDGALSFSLGLPGAFTQDLAAGGDVSLFFTATDSEVGFTWFGKDSGRDGPELAVTADAIPEPATAALVLLGVAGLARRRRGA
jgi:hypothetical protein